jgi:hypothetical protein
MPPAFTAAPPYGVPTYGPPPGYGLPAAPPAAQRPALPVARAAAPAPRPAVARAKAPDEPTRPPTPLTMPTPAQLGISTAPSAAAEADWATTRLRLKELGAVGFQVDHLPGGGCRFVCWLPRAQPGASERIETLAGSEAEAIRLGLERAGQWKNGRP